MKDGFLHEEKNYQVSYLMDSEGKVVSGEEHELWLREKETNEWTRILLSKGSLDYLAHAENVIEFTRRLQALDRLYLEHNVRCGRDHAEAYEAVKQAHTQEEKFIDNFRKKEKLHPYDSVED